MRAIILSGAGRYADPWHPYAETSARLAELVAAAGYDVEVRDDVDAALAALRDDVDLVVVNAGDPDGPVPDGVEADAQVEVDDTALAAAMDRGIGVLAMHASASSLRDYPAFDHAIGARWEPEVSWHPPFGEARVHLVGTHAVCEGLDDFTVEDERYANLRLLEVIEPIAEHEEGGVRHPLVWAREFGRSRLVYDALGHDARSYDSAGHRALLARALEWLSHVPAPTADDRRGAAGPTSAT
ncbi:ThuA domain-containing protein [Agromyces aurantiacus]|uniref:ThuA domain-containing protein n=1 Tax=Agromyces aurantiacus TaxID=165814 RepID=A0ABV9R658_9MICO|nr:ThuA domain-containing protein [Agromyces aurantiacus]MBM7503925.1 type 1 glutamine amidotransferase [Agromyces aurantiacus]